MGLLPLRRRRRSGAYWALFRGRSAPDDAIGQTLERAGPLICAGLGVGLAFRAGLFNIGGRGQMLLGAVCAGYVGFTFDLPPGCTCSWPLLVGMPAAPSGAPSPVCSRRAPARTR